MSVGMLASLGAWFYRGSKPSTTPVAHWIFHVENTPACNSIKPRPDGFVWRHPTHDRHIPKCKKCQEIVEPKPDAKE